MHAIALNNNQFGRHPVLLAAMYRLRCSVFKDRLDWSVMSHAGEAVGCVEWRSRPVRAKKPDPYASVFGCSSRVHMGPVLLLGTAFSRSKSPTGPASPYDEVAMPWRSCARKPRLLLFLGGCLLRYLLRCRRGLLGFLRHVVLVF